MPRWYFALNCDIPAYEEESYTVAEPEKAFFLVSVGNIMR